MELDPNKNKAKVYSRVFQIMLILFAFLVVFILFFSFMSGKGVDYSDADFIQPKQPSDDATVVVFETTEGTIKAVLYEEQAPNYCKYFKELVEDGYFDGTYVCTVLKSENGQKGGFIGGSKTTDGRAGEDSDLKMTKIEVSTDLLPIRGSLCSMVKKGGIFTKSKAGSVVTFVNDVVDIDELKENYESRDDVNGLGKVTDMFAVYGGVPNFLQQYTVFGQVYDGWETLEKISSAQINGEGTSDDDENKDYTPVEEIKFTKVYLSTYGEQKQNGYNIPIKGQAISGGSGDSQ